MPWTVEYFEQSDGVQPAETFEDWLDGKHAKLAGKLLRLVDEIPEHGYSVGGGYLEPCHDYPGIWEIRARHQRILAREFLGFDMQRAVLLHGYVKRADEPAHLPEFDRATQFWSEYLRTRRISPEKEVTSEQI